MSKASAQTKPKVEAYALHSRESEVEAKGIDVLTIKGKELRRSAVDCAAIAGDSERAGKLSVQYFQEEVVRIADEAEKAGIKFFV